MNTYIKKQIIISAIFYTFTQYYEPPHVAIKK